MPFDSLSKDQQKFITDHFKAGSVFSLKKTKSANEEFNDDLQRALTPLYERANKISKTIDTLEAKGYEHTPFELYRGVLEDILSEVPKIMKTEKKKLKNREVPSFEPVASQLKELEDRLAKRIAQIKAGNNVDKATDEDKRTHDKETIANKIQVEIDQHQTMALDVFRDVKAKTKLAFFDDVQARDKAIADYKTLHAGVSKTLTGYASKEAQDDTVLPEPFRELCETARDNFVRDGDTLLAVLDALTKKDQVDQDALDGMLASETYAGLDNVKLEKARMAVIQSEAKKLTDALASQKEKLEALRAEFREADADEKKKLRGKYEALTGHIANIESRKAQIEGFKKGQLERERQLVAAADLARLASERVVGFDGEERPDEDPGWIDPSLSSGKSPEAVLEDVAALRVAVGAAAKRQLIIPKLVKEEPPVMELTAAEEKTLLAMLKAAENYANAGRPEMAEALCFEVRVLKGQFTSARHAMKLPPAPPPVPSIAKQLIATLTALEAEANDRWGLGAEGAEEQITECQKLRKKVQEAEDKGKFIETPDLYEKETDDLRKAIDLLVATVGASDEFKEKAGLAGKKADEIAKFLNGALKTEPLTDKDIVEVPGTAYSEKELKHLVPADCVIMVDVDGKPEKHKIVTKQGRGGQVRARRDDKDIPFEVLEAMHSRNQTLRAMTETGATGPGAEKMLEDYTKEANDWLDDVQKNGSTLYPELAELIKDCDKIFAKGKVAEFIPDDFGTVKTKYDAFKAGYMKKMPSVAKEEGDKIKEWVEALESAATRIATAYKAHKKVYEGILADLKGKKNKSEDGAAVGKLMEDVLSKSPEELFKGASDPDKVEALSKALDHFKKVKKFYESNSKTLSAKQMDGKWMTDTKAAYKKLDSKVGDNVKEAGEELAKLRQDINDFNDKMSSLDSASGSDLAERLIELCDSLWNSAKNAQEEFYAARNYHKKLDELAEALKLTKGRIRSRGKIPAALQLKDQLDALVARHKGTKAKMKADEAYDQGLTELEEIELDLKDLDELVAELEPGKKVEINAVRIGTRLPALEKFLEGLKGKSGELVEKDIRPRMDDMESEKQEEIEPAVAKVDGNLKQVKDVLDLKELKKIGVAIDKALDDAQAKPEPKNTKAARIKLREAALKEIRALRSRLDAHPAVKMYGENPFDGAQQLRLVNTALHHVEIAVLGCVSPKEAD